MAKCLKCGVESPDGATRCSMCGSSLVAGNRQCVSCGRSIDWATNVCPYCGYDFRYVSGAPEGHTISDSTKFVLYVLSVLIPIAGIIVGIYYMTRSSQEEKGVGRICLIIGVVVTLLTVGLAGLLYVMVMGFGSDTTQTPTTSLIDMPTVGGWRFTFASVNDEVEWTDVAIIVNDGLEFVSWSPLSQDLEGSIGVSEDYGTKTLSGLFVTLTVTDLAGNGRIDAADHFTLSASPGFDPATDYTVSVVYDPTGGLMCAATFSG